MAHSRRGRETDARGRRNGWSRAQPRPRRAAASAGGGRCLRSPSRSSRGSRCNTGRRSVAAENSPASAWRREHGTRWHPPRAGAARDRPGTAPDRTTPDRTTPKPMSTRPIHTRPRTRAPQQHLLPRHVCVRERVGLLVDGVEPVRARDDIPEHHVAPHLIRAQAIIRRHQ